MRLCGRPVVGSARHLTAVGSPHFSGIDCIGLHIAVGFAPHNNGLDNWPVSTVGHVVICFRFNRCARRGGTHIDLMTNR